MAEAPPLTRPSHGPLSPPVGRKHYHTREIEVQGYYREDGLWDIEGHMRDTKSYAFSSSHMGEMTPGRPIHDMWLRITLDDDLTIQGAEAVTASGPYHACGDINPAYEALIGLRIGPGFHRSVKQRLGGLHGCTHLTELLYPMATVGFQTVFGSRERAFADHGRELPPPSGKRPGYFNTCHALRVDGETVKELYPQWYEERGNTADQG